MITLEYPDFYFVTVYTPNSQNELKRLDYRMTWEDAFLAFLKELDAKKTHRFVRRSQRSAQGNRPQTSKIKPQKRRLFR